MYPGKRWIGPLLTLATIAAIELLARTVFKVPNPLILIVLAVIYSAFSGGLFAGGVSAAIAVLYGFYFFADPGLLFSYTPDNFARVLVLAGSVPLAAFLVGLLKLRHDRMAGALLQTREQEHEMLARIAPLGIFRTDAAGDCFYVNEKWRAMTGLSYQESLGRGWVNALHPADRDRVTREWNDSAGNGASFQSEYRLSRDDGKTTWVLGHAETVKSPEGRVSGYIGTVTDITDRKRVEEELQGRLSDLEVLQDISQHILAASDLKAILQVILTRIVTFASFDLGAIRLLDPSDRTLKPVASYGYHDESRIISFDLGAEDAGRGRMQKAAFTGHTPYIEENLSAEPGHGALKAEGVQSVIIAPMETEGEALGTILLGTRAPRKFSPEQLRLIAAVGNQVGIAVQKTWLVETANLRRRHAEALREIGVAMTATRDPQAVLDLVAREAQRLTGAMFAYVVLPAKPFYQFAAVAGDDQGYSNVLKLSDDPASPYGQGPLGRAVRERTAMVCEDVKGDPRFAPWKEIASERGIGSLVAVPLQVQGEACGAVITYAGRPRAYDAETIALLTSLAAQAAAALENARLFQEAAHRAKEQDALSSVATATAEALDIDRVLQSSLAKVCEITGRERSYIRLKDPATGNLQLVAYRGISEEYAKSLAKTTAGGKSDSVFTSGEPLVVNDPEGTVLRLATRTEGSAAMGWFPLKVRGQTIGILNVSTARSMPFLDHEVKLLQAISNVIGVAIGNARLYEESERRAREQEALSSVATATAEALDIDRVLQISLEKVVDITGREKAYIRLKDPATGNLKVVAHKGISAEYVGALSRKQSGTRSDRVFVSGEPHVVNSLEAAPGSGRAYREGIVALARIPIKARGAVVGILNVATSRPLVFTDEEVNLLQGIANVIGVALDNARLYDGTKRSLERLRALHEIDAAILSVLDVEAVLKILLEKIDYFLPYASATVRLWNKESGILEPVACRNLPEDEWKADQWKAGRGSSNVAFDTRRPVTIANCQNDPRIKDPSFFCKHGLVSCLGIPLIAGEDVLGVISFYTKEEHEFTEEETEFLDSLAGQAAVAIQHSLLYREVTRREAQLQQSHRYLEALHGVTVQASQSLDLDTVTHGVIQKITEVFDFDATRIYLLNERGDKLGLKAQFDRDPVEFAEVRSFPRGQGIVGRVTETGTPLIFEDVTADPAYRANSKSKSAKSSGHRFFAAFPIKGRRQGLGAMVCMGDQPRRLSAEEIQLLTSMTGQVAVAVENASLYQAINERADELQTKTWELETANRVKSEFLSVMSHELRTPLSVVVGYTGMLKDGMLGGVNPQQEAALQQVLTRASEQLAMINDIMQTTQIESRAVVVDRHATDLRDFLERLKLDYEATLDKKNVALVWNYPAGPVSVTTDSGKLKQIVQNLINNAIKFTDKGTITIAARLVSPAPPLPGSPAGGQGGRGAGERWVEVAVTDTGIGIPKDQQEKIFEKFHQVDSSETRLYGGVGLGLYIVKQFTDLLGGNISLESEPGKGTTFTVKLPA
jgi:PAS domain S-box-containing protein